MKGGGCFIKVTEKKMKLLLDTTRGTHSKVYENSEQASGGEKKKIGKSNSEQSWSVSCLCYR